MKPAFTLKVLNYAFPIKVLYCIGAMMRFVWMSFFISIYKNETKSSETKILHKFFLHSYLISVYEKVNFFPS